MTINEIQDEIIEEFNDFDDWMDRYQMLIDLGNDIAPLDDKYKTDDNLIDGCQSRVWVQCDLVDGRTDCKGHRRPFAARSLGQDATGDYRCRPIFHRPHRTARASVADTGKRTAGNDKANKNLRHAIQ